VLRQPKPGETFFSKNGECCTYQMGLMWTQIAVITAICCCCHCGLL
jgi:hypothetical protein